MVRGQLSLELALIFLAILLASLITITDFTISTASEKERALDKIDSAGKAAVMLVNSKYNGINANTTLIYCGMNWSEDKKNITIYIMPKDVSEDVKNFIKEYIYNRTNISKDNITIVIG
jgi:uncharacterized protein (UPF0333 family)